jgi:hypothetical protein
LNHVLNATEPAAPQVGCGPWSLTLATHFRLANLFVPCENVFFVRQVISTEVEVTTHGGDVVRSEGTLAEILKVGSRKHVQDYQNWTWFIAGDLLTSMEYVQRAEATADGLVLHLRLGGLDAGSVVAWTGSLDDLCQAVSTNFGRGGRKAWRTSSKIIAVGCA